MDLRTLVLPCSPLLDPTNWTLSPPRNPLLPKPPRLQLALLIDEFTERVGQSYLDLWTALGQNRCRLRRMLTHVISGWDQLQIDAGMVDDDLMRVVEEMGIQDDVMKYPLTAWVYHKKLWMCEKVVLMGFEQDIYLPDEYASQYAFLSSLSSRRTTLLQNISAHFTARIAGGAPTGNADAANELEEGAEYVLSLLAEAQGISSLSAALSAFYTVLLYLGLLPTPPRPFSSEALRYELRMKPFLTLSPPEVLPFEEFQAQLQPYGPWSSPTPSLDAELSKPDFKLWRDIDAHLKAAKDCFSVLKKGGAKRAKAGGVQIVWGKEVQGALASCVALGVAVVGVRNAVKDKGIGKLGIKVELPGMRSEEGKAGRYSEGWVVGKVVNL